MLFVSGDSLLNKNCIFNLHVRIYIYNAKLGLHKILN